MSNYANYEKINFLLKKINNKLYLKFHESFLENFNKVWGESKLSKDKLLDLNIFKKDDYRLNIICKKESNQWDLSIIIGIFLCRNFKSDIDLNKLKRIKNLRNKFSHMVDSTISEEDYCNFRKQIAECFTEIKLKSSNYANINEIEEEMEKELEKKTAQACKTEDLHEKQIQEKSKQFDQILNNYEKAIELIKTKYFFEAIKLIDDCIIKADNSKYLNSIFYSRKALCLLFLSRTNDEKDQDNNYYLNESLMYCKLSIYEDLNIAFNYLLLGKIYEEKSKQEKAIANYEKYLNLNSKSINSNSSFAQYHDDSKKNYFDNQNIFNQLGNWKADLLNIFIKGDDFVRNKISQIKVDNLSKKFEHFLHPSKLPNRYQEEKTSFMNDFKTRTGLDDSENAFNKINEMIIKKYPDKQLVFVGHEYRDGINGKKQDFEKAVQYYTMAMRKNNAEAVFNLALLYFKGKGVELDYSAGFSLLIKAAKMQPKVDMFGILSPNIGVAEAQFNLGRMYENGIYVEKNERKSLEYYNQAVENESADAANNLGLIYLNSKSILYNPKKAEEMLTYAHKIGSYDASVNLVSLYLEQNQPELAKKWHKIGLEEGHHMAYKQDENMNLYLAEIENDLNENNNHQKIKQVLDSVIQDALKEDPALKAFHEDIESQKKIIENNEKVEPLTWVLPEKEKKICSSIDQKEKEYLQSGILKEEFSKLNSNITIIPKYRRVFQNISNIREILKDYQFDKNSLKVIEVISLLKDSLEKEESIILFESSQFSLITDLIQKILINPYFLQSLQIKIDSELEEKLILIQGYIYMKNFQFKLNFKIKFQIFVMDIKNKSIGNKNISISSNTNIASTVKICSYILENIIKFTNKKGKKSNFFSKTF